MAFDDNKKIGTGLLVLGFIFLFLGVVLFFDAALLAMGDLLFLMGITLTIGMRRTFVFFFKPHKPRRQQLRSNLFFFGGMLAVLTGRRWAAILGMMFQVMGFLNLFGPMIPIAFAAMRQLPVIGTFMELPGISYIFDKIAGAGSSSQQSSSSRRVPV